MPLFGIIIIFAIFNWLYVLKCAITVNFFFFFFGFYHLILDTQVYSAKKSKRVLRVIPIDPFEIFTEGSSSKCSRKEIQVQVISS
jgi:hypothetical protein